MTLYIEPGSGLTDILYQGDGDYCMGRLASRWGSGGMRAWGAGGRYPSEESGLIVVGVVGVFVGGWLAGLLGIHIGRGLISSIITATIGAIILILLVRAVMRRRQCAL
jgi:uncharacterized membrane protein YeaQ/YmgE (transglycosylase-associated protein family)